jgi:threonine dehydratase
MERLGARVVRTGATFDEAREWAESEAPSEGDRHVHSVNETALVASVGTAGLEVVEYLPGVDYLFCPVGGGSSASAYCLTVAELADAAVVGVQSEAAPAMHRAWAEDTLAPYDLRDAVATLFREERVVMEGACGASLAGARAMADEIAGSTVVMQVSGRNVDEAVLRDILGW